MMETEVTQELYLAVMGENPSIFNGIRNGTDYGVDLQRPVENVSWEDGIRFASALSLAMGLQPAYDGDDNDAGLIEGANGFRYPLEAEWEWAARCGEDYEYPGSNDVHAVGWCLDYATHPVGQKQANACGLRDMVGNLWEWVADDYNNPGQYHPGADERVRRGGSWVMLCNLTARFRSPPDFSNGDDGLRLLRPLP